MQKNTIEGFIEARNGAELKNEYDRFCYSLVTDHPSLGLEAKYDIITKYPDDWIDYYKASRYEKIDPAPQQGFKMIRPFTWEAAGQAPDVDSAGRRVLKKSREAGLFDGIAAPVHWRNGEAAGFSPSP